MIMKALHEHEQFPTNNRGIRDTGNRGNRTKEMEVISGNLSAEFRSFTQKWILRKQAQSMHKSTKNAEFAQKCSYFRRQKAEFAVENIIWRNDLSISREPLCWLLSILLQWQIRTVLKLALLLTNNAD